MGSNDENENVKTPPPRAAQSVHSVLRETVLGKLLLLQMTIIHQVVCVAQNNIIVVLSLSEFLALVYRSC